MEGWELRTQAELRKTNSCSNYEDNAKGSPGLLSQIFHLDLPNLGVIDLLCTSLVNNYSSKYKGIIGTKLPEVSPCQAMSSPALLLSLSNMTVKKP